MREEKVTQCDCCGKMAICDEVIAMGMDTNACEECREEKR